MISYFLKVIILNENFNQTDLIKWEAFVSRKGKQDTHFILKLYISVSSDVIVILLIAECFRCGLYQPVEEIYNFS